MTDIPASALMSSRAKYRPHLDFRTKCAIYALYHWKGVSPGALRKAYGVHKLTIRHIIDDNPRHYADVQARAMALSMPGLYDAYVTQADIDALKSASSPLARTEAQQMRIYPRSNANQYEGAHMINSVMVNIDWLGADNASSRPEGWYWRYGNGAVYNGIPINRGATSSAVYEYLEANLKIVKE